MIENSEMQGGKNPWMQCRWREREMRDEDKVQGTLASQSNHLNLFLPFRVVAVRGLHGF